MNGKTRLTLTLSLAGILLASVTSATAQVACGDVLTGDTLLTSSLTCTGPGLTLASDDIILDCDGHRIQGSGVEIGVLLDGVSRVGVRNCIVTDFAIGFSLESASSNYLVDNLAEAHTSSGNGGFRLTDSDGNVLEGNRSAANSGRGFVLTNGSDGNLLVSNEAIDNGFRGFDLNTGSDANTLALNSATGNATAGIVVSGASDGNTLYRNTVSDSTSEGIALIGSQWNQVYLNDADDNGTYGYTDSTVAGNNFYVLNDCAGNVFGPSSPAGLCSP